MDENKNVLAIRIKELRLFLKLTQEELALKLGLKGKSSIANYESGKIAPSDEIKLRMCKIFNCSMDYLMGVSNLKSSETEYFCYVKKSIMNFLLDEYIPKLKEIGLTDDNLSVLKDFYDILSSPNSTSPDSMQRAFTLIQTISNSNPNIDKPSLVKFHTEITQRYCSMCLYSDRFVPYYADINMNYYNEEIYELLVQDGIEISNIDLKNLEQIMNTVNAFFFPNCKIVPSPISTNNNDFRYAEYNGINTEGLDENDIEEIKRFVEFVKNKKMNDKK